MSADAYHETEEETTLTTDVPGDDGATLTPPASNAAAGGDAAAAADIDPEGLPLDVVFDILKNERRRLVLEYLRDADDTVTIGELAEHIAAIENDTTVQQLNAQQRKRVYIGLYQCHLPKMDDANVVAFNQNRGRITLAEPASELFHYLDVDDEDEPETKPRYYGALSIGAGVLFVVAHVLGAPTAAIGLVFALLVVAALALSFWGSDGRFVDR